MRFSVLHVLLTFGIPIAGAGWIDDETPLNRRTTTSLVDGTVYNLVMSDEFNVENRTFGDGSDPMWTALDKSDDDASSAGGGSMQFYNSSTVSTQDGFLKIATKLQKTSWERYDHIKHEWKHEVKNFTSGMVQSWNKFCFTGGIVEVDVIFPGQPHIGGLWPAVWMMGNLGRATYEPSTNNVWPWSYDKCDREKQQAQAISACNRENHYGMHPFQGRGATEIDIVEVMPGNSNGPLPSTDPPIELPYADLTLQVAPGVPKNRPQSGNAPLRKSMLSENGHTLFAAQTWYENLEMQGNTSINPFFYGTYLGETQPNEPVTRTKKQAFQADAIGAAHQLTPSHFNQTHTFRLEWQPGPGGRIDWFVKSRKVNATTWIDGDGLGKDWLRAFTIRDKNLKDLMGSQIPIEPSYLIFNVAISSTWGFPYDVPEWCSKCYDCNDPKCACSFYPGFCPMLETGDVAMYIDSVRVYQSTNASAHVGANHTLGCDPPEYPTREWIQGHSYEYMRNPPFGYYDKDPIKKVVRGGGRCTSDSDCGADVKTTNWTAVAERAGTNTSQDEYSVQSEVEGRGKCVASVASGMFGSFGPGKICSCFEGFTGPHCLAQHFTDETASAMLIRHAGSPFDRISRFTVPNFMLIAVGVLLTYLCSFLFARVREEKLARLPKGTTLQKPAFRPTANTNVTLVTGTSI